MKINLAIKFIMHSVFLPMIITDTKLANADESTTSPTVSQTPPINLSGSFSKLQYIVSNSEYIFVGKITELGEPLAKAGDFYPNVPVKVIKKLKGSIPPLVNISFVVKPEKESSPPLGSPHIFFVKRERTWFIAKKIIKANDDNIAIIQRLISSAAN